MAGPNDYTAPVYWKCGHTTLMPYRCEECGEQFCADCVADQDGGNYHICLGCVPKQIEFLRAESLLVSPSEVPAMLDNITALEAFARETKGRAA